MSTELKFQRPLNHVVNLGQNIQTCTSATRHIVSRPEDSGSNDAGSDHSPLVALGSCLRDAREQQGLSCAALAAQLRMGAEQLQALEAGDQQRLPELVFVIAQARRVADALGVDVNPLVGPLKQHSGHLRPGPAPLTNPQPAKSTQQRTRPLAWSWLGGLAVLALGIAAGVWGWERIAQQERHARANPASQRAPKTASQPTPPPSVAPELTIRSAEPSWLTVRTPAGRIVFEGIFEGSRRFPLGSGLELRAGRPDLVYVSQENTPAKPLGRIDQIRWVSIKDPQR